MTKKYFLRMHVHASNASFSSEDVLLYREVAEESARNAVKSGMEFEEDDQIMIVYLLPDQTYQYGHLGESHKNDPGFQDLVQSYIKKGFSEVVPQEIEDFRVRQEEEHWRKRKEEDYVLYKNYKEMSPEEYQGGFSDKVFNQEILQTYVEGTPFGWIGHKARKPELDTHLEKKFLALRPKVKVDLVELLACWLTSTSGRHFGDSVDGLVFDEQKKKIDRNVHGMFNEAYIFNKPEHKGTYKSSCELYEKYKEVMYA